MKNTRGFCRPYLPTPYSRILVKIGITILHFFIPYIKGKGVRDLYEIIRVRTITSEEAEGAGNKKIIDNIRLAFELRYSNKLFPNYRWVNFKQMIDYTYIDTTFDKQDEWLYSESAASE